MSDVLLGDCLEKLKNIESETVDLIYLDPPFYTQQIQKLTKIKEDKINEYQFADTWNNLKDYIYFMQQRLNECYRVLKKTGSIFLHCDRNSCHYLKIVLDEIFGYGNFRSEIIWAYKRWSNSKKGLLNSHQNIFFYSKTNDFKFNTIYTDYSLTTNVDQILQNRKRDENGLTVYKKNQNGKIENNFNKKGVPLSDVWNIPYLNPKAKERNGYPTQKPILLLEQIIKISSDEKDLVLDPFCGSGTTLAAAKLLNRQYIGIDVSCEAVALCNQRLSDKIIKTNSQLLEKGLEKYSEKTDKEIELLNLIGAIPVQRNSGIDGIISSENPEKVVAIKIQKETESIEETITKLVQACSTKQINKKIIIKNQHQKIHTLLEQEIISQNKDVLIIDSYKDIILNKLNFIIEN